MKLFREINGQQLVLLPHEEGTKRGEHLRSSMMSKSDAHSEAARTFRFFFLIERRSSTHL